MKGKYTNAAGVACGIFVAIMLLANAIAGSSGNQAGAKASDIPADAVTVTGTAPGMMGDVTVEVTATPERLYQIKVVEENETPEIGGLAAAQLPGDIYEAQSLDVDDVTGATVTSTAIKNAIRNGLDSAGISTATFESAAPADVTKGVAGDATAEPGEATTESGDATAEPAEATTESGDETTEPAETTESGDATAELMEGGEEIPADAVTARGTAKGINGDVTVEVTATPDRLYRVNVVEQSETEGIGSLAVAQLPGDILNAQSLQVDGVTGATVTSEAIKNAIRNALETAGVSAAAFEAAPAVVDTAKEPDVTYDTDIVVIGAGGAGMTAAVVAADAGRNVVVVESMPMVGGNSIRSTGGMNAAKTVYQDENAFAESAGVEKQLEAAAGAEYAGNEAIQELASTVAEQWAAYQENAEGYFDSAELFQLDTLIGGHGINDPALVKKLAEESAGAIDWLHTIGADLQSVSSFGGASVKRIHRPVDESGKTVSVGEYIVPILQENLNKRDNITLYLNTKATQITKDDGGKVVGIVAEGPTGNKVTINAKAVIDTAGGFGANHEKVVSYRADLDGFTTTNASGIQGQGIDMAVAIGAATVDMEQIQIHPTVEYNTSNLITEGLRGDGAILVNADGYRFYDEVSTRDKVSAAEIEQPGSFSWLIIDSKMVENSNVIQGYIRKGYTVEGNTYEELAEAMGVPAQTFRDTMEFWNSCAANKNDPLYGRTSFAEPLDLAPFYAIKVTAGIHHTMGGLKIDPDAEVFDTSGNVIPGLYAAGEVTGGVHGGNRLGGNAVADFVVFGRIAGANAAEFVGSVIP
ncbi:MAG: flavocytochrome c [Oscillibacter sp.]|nr:flavocytochrome c [Oscillibacter sp.]